MITLNTYKTEVTDALGLRHYYDTENNPYVSVTTLLGKYEYSPILDSWKAKLGPDEADKVRNEAAERGKAIHSHIEHYLLDKDSYNLDTACFSNVEKEDPKIKKYIKTLINNFFSYVIPISAEEPILVDYSSYKYAGRYDAINKITSQTAFHVGTEDNSLLEGNYLIDIKTKRSLPRLDDSSFLLKNMLQMAAYFKPLENKFNLKGAILVYTTATKCLPVYIGVDKLNKLFEFFTMILEDYYTGNYTLNKNRETKDLWVEIKKQVDCYYDFTLGGFNNYLPDPIYLCNFPF